MWYVISKITGNVLYVSDHYFIPVKGTYIEWRDLPDYFPED
jgi:cellulose biosynthesis protein BcsQ